MEILIDSDVLLEGLGRVKAIVSNKGLIPILGCFVFEATENKFSISASSDELTMRWEIGEDAEFIDNDKKEEDTSTIEDSAEGEKSSKPVRKDVLKIKEKGKIATLASRFYDIVNKLGSSVKVLLKTDEEGGLFVKCETLDAKATLTKDAAIDLEDFPKIHIPEMKEIELPSNFHSMLKISQISICDIESRFDLKGLNVSIKEGALSLRSCDNKRISSVTGKINSAEVEESFFISRDAVKELLRMKPTSFYIGPENHLTFKNITTTFLVQLLENKFPNLDKFIALADSGKDKLVKVKKQYLKDAIDWVAILSESFDSRVDFEIKKDSITIWSELNTSKTKRKIKAESSEDLKFACNPKYFLDYLNIVDEDTVEFFLHVEAYKIFFSSGGSVYITTPKK
jgi:DNA polymerase III sliding clamp (beta) subunit (PCNA family)